MGQVDAIYRRRSIKKYLNEELQVGILDEAKELCKCVKKLYEDIDMDIHVIEDGIKIQNIITGVIGPYGKIKAPHYIVVTSNKKEGYLENAGFAIESIVLSLTDLGIGTCFIGNGINKKLLENIVPINENHEVLITISFGYSKNQEKIKKKIYKRRKRMEVSEFTSGYISKAWLHILDGVRMAPSAMNSQPWRFFINKNIIDIYSIDKTLKFTRGFKEMNRIAVGAALYHVFIMAKGFDKEIEIKRLPGKEKSGYTYITSIIEIQ